MKKISIINSKTEVVYDGLIKIYRLLYQIPTQVFHIYFLEPASRASAAQRGERDVQLISPHVW